MVRLYSLLSVEDKILEANYFAIRLNSLHGDAFTYELNAFLSAARSVTFYLQKEMAGIPLFEDWWASRQKEMASDPAMVFFRDMRNVSQKERRIPTADTFYWSDSRTAARRRTFLSSEITAASHLPDQDIVESCLEHLGKLAKIAIAFAEAFPYYSCYRRAITVDGLHALGLTMEEIVEFAGYPREWADATWTIPQQEALRILQGKFDAVDFDGIESIARYSPK